MTADGAIRYEAAPGSLTEDLRRLVKENRAALLVELRRRSPDFTVTAAALAAAKASPAPAVVLAQLIGLPTATFVDWCRGVIGRPGPSTAAEDARMFDEIVRRCEASS